MTKRSSGKGTEANDLQNASARVGGEAQGGIVAAPDDPDTPRAARKRAAASDEAMKDEGFGDHKGSRI